MLQRWLLRILSESVRRWRENFYDQVWERDDARDFLVLRGM